MLDINYNMKLIDFGDARVVNEKIELDDDEGDEAIMELQRRGTFVGTVNYQSPEMIDGEDQGHPMDIWALGCILFKMFTGVVPFKG